MKRRLGALKSRNGFTIVELLIVIVVIAILAAITIVAYNGIQDRAKNTAAQSAVSQAAKRVQQYFVENTDTYPANQAAFDDLNINSGSASYQYVANNSANPKTFCITATVQNKSFYVNNTDRTSPTEGGCAGHGQGGVAAITNLATNPSVESNATSGWGTVNGSVLNIDNSQRYHGSYSIRSTMPALNASSTGISIYTTAALSASTLKPNTTYNVSLFVYIPSATVDLYISVQGSALGSLGPSTQVSTKNAWTRVSRTFTTNASGNIVIYVLNSTATTANMQFWSDALMITEGSQLYNYADGSTPNWAWSGAVNNSQSTGPGL
jgi:prepilin-type N-terminal cleavage/methylation domain-containing protein